MEENLEKQKVETSGLIKPKLLLINFISSGLILLIETCTLLLITQTHLKTIFHSPTYLRFATNPHSHWNKVLPCDRV